MNPRQLIASELQTEKLQTDPAYREMDDDERRDMQDYLGRAVFDLEPFFEADEPAPYVVNNDD